MLTSYHNHTNWSDGAPTLAAQIEAARRAGLDELGISDHYVLYPGGGDAAQMKATYDAIRGTGNNTLIFMEAGAGADGNTSSLGSTSARWLFTALYYLLPNLANYSFITPAAHGRAPAPGFVFATALYAVVYIAVILAGATLVFSRRNFK